MDTNLILAHNRFNHSLSSMVSAHQFLDQGRPLSEVLALTDQAIVGLHDAKAEMVRFRETVYDQHKAEQDSHNLEGPGKTPEQAAEDRRALFAAYPTPADRFKLMLEGPAEKE